MRIQRGIVLALAIVLFICTYHGTKRASTEEKALLDLDIVQRTCALDVVVRSLAFAIPTLFDLDLEDTVVPPPLEVRPSEPMLACTPPPTEQGDTAGAGASRSFDPEPRDTTIPVRWSVQEGEPVLACMPPPAAQEDAIGTP
jgi:hypothetical protein